MNKQNQCKEDCEIYALRGFLLAVVVGLLMWGLFASIGYFCELNSNIQSLQYEQSIRKREAKELYERTYDLYTCSKQFSINKKLYNECLEKMWDR